MALKRMWNYLKVKSIRPIRSRLKLKQSMVSLIDEVSELRFKIDQHKRELERIMSSQLERESLETHVELCAIRYEQLNMRLTSLENSVDDIKQNILRGQQSLKTVLIGTSGTVITTLLGLILTLLYKF